MTKYILRVIVIWVVSAFFSACAPLYFKSLPPPATVTKIDSIDTFLGRDMWYGIVFNGEKVGFSHFVVTAYSTSRYRIQSETHLLIRFLGLKKRVNMVSEDIVSSDLSLQSFHYRQTIDEGTTDLKGEVKNGELGIGITTPSSTSEVKLPVTSNIYPTSIINLYPPLHGMSPGAQFTYQVFEPQTMAIYEVIQRVVGYEFSPKLGVTEALKIETEMEGYSVTTWINKNGETEMELGMGGVLITYREDEHEAKKFLVEASLSKKDLAWDFSLIKTSIPISCPREAVSLTVAISGIPPDFIPPSGPMQEVTIGDPAGTIIRLNREIQARDTHLSESEQRLYLASTPQIEAHHREIQKLAHDLTTHARDDREKVTALVTWVAREIADEPVDSFSALEVLKKKRGECQAHAILYTALARAANIPTRLVGGLVYMKDAGFLYHSWAESYAGGWIPVDPTFGQIPIDATHIKLVQGHDWSSFLPLGNLVGHIAVDILNYQCPSPTETTHEK